MLGVAPVNIRLGLIYRIRSSVTPRSYTRRLHWMLIPGPMDLLNLSWQYTMG